MLGFTFSSEPFRVIGIDPGTSLGVALLEVNLDTGVTALLDAVTLSGLTLMRDYPIVTEVHGTRTARIHAFEIHLSRYFAMYEPHAVICESPYLGRLPQAFASLTETVGAIRRAVMSYDCLMPLDLVDPPTAKKAVGVIPRRKADKEDVRQAVLKSKDFVNPYDIPIETLDEHCIDAIAVSIYRIKKLLHTRT